jgi:hypothetical protein
MPVSGVVLSPPVEASSPGKSPDSSIAHATPIAMKAAHAPNKTADLVFKTAPPHYQSFCNPTAWQGRCLDVVRKSACTPSFGFERSAALLGRDVGFISPS